MTAQQFLQSKEPNVFIIPEEWLEEYANIVLNIAAEKAKIDMKKKSNYGKSRKWQKVKEDLDNLKSLRFEYRTLANLNTRENNIEISAKDKLKQKIEKLNTEFTNNYIE